MTVIPNAFDGERVDRVVSMLCDLTRKEASELVAAGGVRLGGRPVTLRSRRVTEGELLEIDAPAPAEAPGELEADPGVEVPVVFADDHVVVVDKPAGLVVHPGAGRRSGTLVHGLLARYPDIAAVGDPARPGVVHRLDRGTSGLLMVARTPLAYGSLVSQLAARTVDRRYLALAWGHFDNSAGVVDAPIGRGARDRTRMTVTAGGRSARTGYQVLESYDQPAEATLVECRLETGRTHQVRVHLAAIGHPVVGDVRYGGARPYLAPGRPFLHAAELGFDHPATGERVRFESPLPPDLENVRETLH
ncbi:MAG: rRNA synthase [Actinomycetota bacterium]|nr:rRNA synthase [Actinomycetota bacterium]